MRTQMLLLESVHNLSDHAAKLTGLIVIDSTRLGPALGGCRLWSYDEHESLATDSLALARSMTLKAAIAGLPFGGGHASICRPAGRYDRAALFAAVGRAVDRLGGLFLAAESLGTSVDDMRAMRSTTPFVASLARADGQTFGSPSNWTAEGVVRSIAMVTAGEPSALLPKLKVAVQGAGRVGSEVCRLLHERGAKLLVADLDQARAKRVAERFGGVAVDADEIVASSADVFSPCAAPFGLTAQAIAPLKAAVVCGAANNQLATLSDAWRLHDRGILHCPDYVVNAGGLMYAAESYLKDGAPARDRLDAIALRLSGILGKAAAASLPPTVVAEQHALALIDEAPLSFRRVA